jgi:LysM repeat protein
VECSKDEQWPARFGPKNPANHSLYTVKRGETLTSVASKRKGLTASDLAWLNGLRAGDRLKIGQQLKVPNQAYLDAGRAAKNNFLALAYYIDTHGHLPPDPSHAPRPTADAAHRPPPINKNGYRYDFDSAIRTIDVRGELSLQRERRSRSAQENAGKPDRRRSDDGGHFIAARFNGPREWFNHFAQDAKFNRGAYRVLEDGWARDVRAGKKVFVDIIPHYHGESRRPSSLNIV